MKKIISGKRNFSTKLFFLKIIFLKYFIALANFTTQLSNSTVEVKRFTKCIYRDFQRESVLLDA